MTPDEIRKMLQAAGVSVGEWGETVEGEVRSPVLERQKVALGKVEVLLQRQVEEDQRKVAELHAVLQRLKHGGGM